MSVQPCHLVARVYNLKKATFWLPPLGWRRPQGRAVRTDVMSGELLTLDDEKPFAQYLIAGWKRQWSDGGEISGGLPQYLMEKLGARKIGEMGKEVSTRCYPFHVAGTHDAYRPGAAFRDGLPSKAMYREN